MLRTRPNDIAFSGDQQRQFGAEVRRFGDCPCFHHSLLREGLRNAVILLRTDATDRLRGFYHFQSS